MLFAEYLDEIRTLHKSGQTTEHSFRPALARLFQSIDPVLEVINEPKRLTDVGAPDFVFNRDGVAIGWCEAKDLDKDITTFKTGDYSREQKERYKRSLSNLIYTNGVDFEFLRDGEKAGFVSIADFAPGLPPRPERFDALASHLKDFVSQTPVSITSARQLARMMAGKAALIKDIMARALLTDIASGQPTELTDQFEGFKASLIRDISVEDFADIYAETLAYGLFAARLHDTSLDSFTRAEALDLLPRSNPFLRSLFVYIAGPNLDDRLRARIDELCQIFLATDLAHLLRDFGKFTARNDPFLHFYETFLAEYNPAKRKARGVWYTPEPVVNFIVRAVDDVLQTEFGLADGLADTSKISIDWDTGQNDPKTGKAITIKKDVHRVQILDPATGTGTFLAEVIKLVAGRIKGIAPGQWSGYVEQDLIPRIHGFELLMASYAMCHMKLDMMLTELGYKPGNAPPRLSVYLTNSLEEGERVEQTLPFARWISEEAKGANTIKRDKPIMCVIGNPPYSGESTNRDPWIMGLMDAYKQEPGGQQRLQERNPKWLNDDYVKFIRFAEHMIDKTGEGVLGFITNHGYLDNPTFRGMRWHLMRTFDRIYVLDLHGNAKKKEVCPDGSPDKNVFDIMQGVAIIVAVKHRHDGKEPKPLAEVRQGDLWGSREAKSAALWSGDLAGLISSLLPHKGPQHPFIPRDYGVAAKYEKGFSLAELFGISGNGIVTKRDSLSIKDTADEVWQVMQDFDQKTELEVRQIHKLPPDVRDWRFEWAKLDVQRHLDRRFVRTINYRPFDQRWTLYTGNARGFLGWPVKQIMRHYIDVRNIGLLLPKATRDSKFAHIFATTLPSEAIFLSGSTGSNAMNLPLYLYPEEGTLDQSIRVNFEPKLYAQIRAAAGLDGPLVAPDGSDAFRRATGAARPDEVKVFDYIYGVLHSPAYRQTYAEFLKIDFPRVPFPRDPETFARISAQGEALRRLHLMEDAAIGPALYRFDGEGDGAVAAGYPKFAPDADAGERVGRVFINPDQYFAGVSELAWNFHIGGYQPAQKWLKDRRGRVLGFDDIRHYQKIIRILEETDRIMGEIELPLD